LIEISSQGTILSEGARNKQTKTIMLIQKAFYSIMSTKEWDEGKTLKGHFLARVYPMKAGDSIDGHCSR
jgi:hypothetical protein